MLDAKPNPELIRMERYVGVYRPDVLEISLRSLGFGCGLEAVWDWNRRGWDIGLIGTRGARGLSMSMICNSQPWYGQAFLRCFDADPFQERNDAGSITFRELIAEEPSTEMYSLAFQGDTLRFVFERQAKSNFRKEWVLRRV